MSDTQTHIQLLGEMAVFRNGDLVPLPPSKKPRALLADSLH
jgi:DNA-binding SARP family transcriptional activator